MCGSGWEGDRAAEERWANLRREGCPPQRILGEQFAGDRFDRLISLHDGRTAAAARPLAAA